MGGANQVDGERPAREFGSGTECCCLAIALSRAGNNGLWSETALMGPWKESMRW